MKNIFLLLFCSLIFICSVSAQGIDTGIVEKAKLVVAVPHALQLRAFNNSSQSENEYSQTPLSSQEIQKASQSVTFERKLESPLKNTNFYLLFFGIGASMDAYYAVCSYSDTVILYPRDSIGNNYKDNASIRFLNERLQNEPGFSPDAVMDLFIFYNKLKDPGLGWEIVLHSWKDIDWSDDEAVSQKIKNMIQPPAIKRNGNGYSVTAYVWWKARAQLRKVVFNYSGKSISIKVVELGQYGMASALL